MHGVKLLSILRTSEEIYRQGIELSSRLYRRGSQKAHSICSIRCAFQQGVHSCRYLVEIPGLLAGGGLIVILRPQFSCLSNVGERNALKM